MTTMTPEQYAEKHGIDRATVYRRIKAGKIPIVYEQRQVIRIPVEDATEVAESKD